MEKPYLCPMINAATLEFIQTHWEDDPTRLLLSANRFSGVDVRFAAQQIEARQRMKEKLPQWYATPEIVFPSSLAGQQASSQESARYKQRFVPEGATVIDCTGGLGVDSAAFAAKASKVVYIEQSETLCRTAEHNFKALGLNNIEIQQGSCTDLLPSIPSADFIYIDPSRRSADHKRLFALSDCEPNTLAIKDMLLNKAHSVLVKSSPMADIKQTLRLLPETTQVHVLSVENECKELLFLMEQKDFLQNEMDTVPIICVDLRTAGTTECFAFTMGEEALANAHIAGDISTGYLYEPNASLLKAGAFKLLSLRFGLHKLHQHTHLYWASAPHHSFPGRKFRIFEVLYFNNQAIKTLHHSIPQANVAVRNFCMEAQELRKRLKIKDGGDVTIFGVTLCDNRYALVVATKEH